MDEILAYFTNETGFARLMDGMWDLYARHGRCFGAVRLVTPLADEEKAISDFFKRDYYDQALIRISLAEFERQMQKVFTDAPSLGVLLEAYFERPLTSPVDEARERSKIRDSFTTHVKDELIPMYENTEAFLWLRDMISSMRRVYKYWAELYITNPDAVDAQVKTVCNALNALSQDEYILLSDFSQRICGDAQAFDFYGSHGALFLRALARRFHVAVPSSLEESISLYWQAGLLSNGVLNTVTVSGVLADTDNADVACAYYNSLGEAHVLTLENISRFTGARAYGNKVFIVENNTVFALLCERLRGKQATIICAASGLNAALDRLLTLFCESGTSLYFSGNMDLKGLQLGDHLYLRYGAAFNPWRFGKADYEQALADAQVPLPEEKRKLALHNEVLATMLSIIRKKGKTAGHLPLINLLALDIHKKIGG